MKYKKWKRILLATGASLALLAMAGCTGTSGGDKASSGSETTESKPEATESSSVQEGGDKTDQEVESMDYAEIFKGMKLVKSYKGLQNNNPIIEQHYGADPFALG